MLKEESSMLPCSTGTQSLKLRLNVLGNRLQITDSVLSDFFILEKALALREMSDYLTK